MLREQIDSILMKKLLEGEDTQSYRLLEIAALGGSAIFKKIICSKSTVEIIYIDNDVYM